jgi:hypothetical protein
MEHGGTDRGGPAFAGATAWFSRFESSSKYDAAMSEWDTRKLIKADKKFVWHPFTNMPEWCAPEHEPLV